MGMIEEEGGQGNPARRDPDFFEPSAAVQLLRRMAPTLSHAGRRECLKTADFLEGIEVPGADNPVVISIPVRHNGEYVGMLNTVAHTYINDAHKYDIWADTSFVAYTQAEREEFNGS